MIKVQEKPKLFLDELREGDLFVFTDDEEAICWRKVTDLSKRLVETSTILNDGTACIGKHEPGTEVRRVDVEVTRKYK